MQRTKSKYGFFIIIKKLISVLSAREKIQLGLLQAVALVPALCELMLAGMVALVALSFVSTDKVLQSGIGRKVIELTGWNWLEDQRNLCMVLLLALFVMILIKNTGFLFYNYLAARFSESVSRLIACRLLDFFVRAPWEWHLRQSTADLTFSIGVSSTNGQLLLQIQTLIGYLFTALALLCGIIFADVWVALGLLIISVLAGGGAAWICRRRADRLAGKVFANDITVNQISYFALHGVRELKLWNKEDDVLSRYGDGRVENMRNRASQSVNGQLPTVIMECVSFALLPLIMYYLLEIQNFSMERTLAVMGLLAGSAWRLLPALNRALSCLMSMRSLLPYLEDNLERLELAETVMRDYIRPDPTVQLPFESGITVENLSYDYPNGNHGLRGINMEIRKGGMTGIIGLSGAGKTTLVNVLTMLLPPQAGTVKVDGRPLTGNERIAWRRKIGYVQQSPFIFNGTLTANIALADWGCEPDMDRVRRCCELAQLDFIAELEYGLDTEIGDRGVRLSGGQSQRVAIARALYTEPEILIFDEATSSLDQKNENAIRDTIAGLRNSMTLIMIAHRLSTVQECDRLFWLAEGTVRRDGVPEQILPEYEKFMSRNSAETASVTE